MTCGPDFFFSARSRESCPFCSFEIFFFFVLLSRSLTPGPLSLLLIPPSFHTVVFLIDWRVLILGSFYGAFGSRYMSSYCKPEQVTFGQSSCFVESPNPSLWPFRDPDQFYSFLFFFPASLRHTFQIGPPFKPSSVPFPTGFHPPSPTRFFLFGVICSCHSLLESPRILCPSGTLIPRSITSNRPFLDIKTFHISIL